MSDLEEIRLAGFIFCKPFGLRELGEPRARDLRICPNNQLDSGVRELAYPVGAPAISTAPTGQMSCRSPE